MTVIQCDGKELNVTLLSEASTQQLVDELRDRMAGMSAEDRVYLFSKMTDGYCFYCGSETEAACHCMNDE
jgi:hypothetical protein